VADAVNGEPGGAAEQVLRLLAGVQEWVRHDLGPHLATAPQMGPQTGPQMGTAPHSATGAPECRYCPLCAAIAVLRGDRPEVTEKLVEAGGALLAAVRAAFDSVPAWPGPAEPATNHRVERIDLD
jgi:hypothetical protein